MSISNAPTMSAVGVNFMTIGSAAHATAYATAHATTAAIAAPTMKPRFADGPLSCSQRPPGAPIATGRTGEPAPPCERSGRIIVQESQTLSFASSPRFAFWMLWMPATARL